MAEVFLNQENFETEVLNSSIPVLVDFYADWCGPCKMLSPIIAEIAEEAEGRVKVCKVNVDEASEIAMKYNVVSIPTLILFDKGQVKNTSIGFVPKESILDMLD